MNTLTYDLLALDSLYGILNVGERISLHRKALGKPTTLTPRVKFWLIWLDKMNWEAPSMKYGQDRLAYYEDSDTLRWILADAYPRLHEDLTIQIKILKKRCKKHLTITSLNFANTSKSKMRKML